LFASGPFFVNSLAFRVHMLQRQADSLAPITESRARQWMAQIEPQKPPLKSLIRQIFLYPLPMFTQLALLLLTPALLFGQTGEKDKQALLAKIQDEDTALTWVITGDSITQGAWFTRGARSYPEHLAERVRGELLRVRDFIINTAVSGEVSTGLLEDFEWRVLRFKPDVVSINLGMNDCANIPVEQHKREMGEMITKAREAGAIVILHTTNTVFEEHRFAEKLPPFIEAVRQLAAEHDVMLVDHFQMFSEANQGTENRTWFSDAVHPNGLGHAHMAAEMFRVIGIHDPESNTCKLAQ